MSQANSFEWLMLDLINADRASYGLDPLQLELRLNDSSEDYTQYMLQEDFFSHYGLDGSSPGDRMEDAGFVFSGSWRLGENLAWQSERGASGFEDDVEDLHNSLMNSAGHRANILNPNFDYIGIGIEVGDYKGWEAVMVTQNFATTSAPVQLDTSGGGGSGSGGGGGSSTPEDLVLNGNSGNNSLTGAAGDDTLKGKNGNDVASGNDGNDSIWGGKGNDTLSGNDNADDLYGGGGRDSISGGNGSDELYGGGGKDTLNGGNGDDDLTGGGGKDVFVFSGGDDLVTDFNLASANEVIDLSTSNRITSFSDLQNNHLTSSGGDALIWDGAGNTMRLDGINASDLTANDFVF